MSTAHAVLGPSAAHRWIPCPASIRMKAKVPPPPESGFAAEGTAAHAMAARKAAERFHVADPDPEYDITAARADITASGWDLEAMERHTDDYLVLLEERLGIYPNSVLLLEQRVDTGVPQCWGTADALIVSPEHVEVVDLKYGAGVAVNAEDNPQLRLYGVGALETYGDLLGEAEEVYMTIFQPRVAAPSTAVMASDALRAWRDAVKGPARLALTEDAPFGPSEQACRWCPAAGVCAVRAETLAREAFEPYQDVDADLLTAEQTAEVLARIPDIKAWCAAVEAAALDRAYSSGETIPGYKVVLSGSRRVIRDSTAALQALTAAGYQPEQVTAPAKVLGVTALDRVVGGKQALADLLGEALTNTEGKPALVPASDTRPAVVPETSAAEVFGATQPTPESQEDTPHVS